MVSEATVQHVLIINGSARRQGQTAGLLKRIAALLESEGLRVDWLDLYDAELRPCLGCEACIRRTSACVHDDSEALLARMAGYDGLVVASPVYVGSVSGQLKILIDKTAWWVHRPALVGKPGLAVSTTAGSKLGSVLRYLEYVLIEWGMQPAGKIGRSASRSGPVEPREVARFVNLLRQERANYRPGLREVVSFEVKRVLTRFHAIDRQHWADRGWDQQRFYYRCRLGPLAWAAGLATRVVLGAVIKPPEAGASPRP